jgi:hypothetical protein
LCNIEDDQTVLGISNSKATLEPQIIVFVPSTGKYYPTPRLVFNDQKLYINTVEKLPGPISFMIGTD